MNKRWAFDHFSGWVSSWVMDVEWLIKWRAIAAINESHDIEMIVFKVKVKDSKYAITEIEDLLKKKYPLK